MQSQNGTFQGAKGYRLYYRKWIPEQKAVAVVFVAHGIAEHSGRYSGLGSFLAGRGLAVYAFDYRHHGRSQGDKGGMDDFSLILDDFEIFRKMISQAHPGLKIFLLGHSMGTALSLVYAEKHGSDLAGLVLSGSPLRSIPHIPSLVTALIYPLVVITPNLRLYKLDSATLSRDRAVVDNYNRDPLVFRGKLSCSLAISFLRILHKAEAGIPNIHIPVLVMHGSSDNLCLPEGSDVVLNKIGSTDKTRIIYPGFYHEILNEPEKGQVRQDIWNWLEKQMYPQ
jgi:acylglycerol lipase